MSSPTSDSLKKEIDEGKMKVGNEVLAATGLATGASSIPYIDSSNKLAVGPIPFAIASSLATTVSVLDVTGYATLSADEIMHGTIVAGAGVTTWTKTGFIQINVTDSAGNITNGKHYIQFGTLT